MRENQIYIALLTAYLMGQESGAAPLKDPKHLSPDDAIKKLREMAEKLEKEV